MTRPNRFVRRRRYDQWPSETNGWMETYLGRLCFADAHNEHYGRDKRMQSWRRPL